MLGTISNDLMVVATVVMAVAAIALVWFNYQLVGVTKNMQKATEDSAKATLSAAQVAQLALDVERPYVFVERQKLDFEEVSIRLSSPRTRVTVGFYLYNRGKGVAVISTIRIRLLMMKLSPEEIAGQRKLRRRHFLVDGRRRPVLQAVIGPGEGLTDFVSFFIPSDLWKQVGVEPKADRLFPYIVMLVSYRDVFKRRFGTFHAYEYSVWDTVEDGDLVPDIKHTHYK